MRPTKGQIPQSLLQTFTDVGALRSDICVNAVKLKHRKCLKDSPLAIFTFGLCLTNISATARLSSQARCMLGCNVFSTCMLKSVELVDQLQAMCMLGLNPTEQEAVDIPNEVAR